VPYTIVVGRDIYEGQVAPAYEQAAADRATIAGSLPLEELDTLVDRGILDADPATAAAQTHQIAAEINGVASNQDYLIDNISNALEVAKGDAAIAKRMFVFLGLPGAILAALLTAYAGTLLAGAQRRENALLRSAARPVDTCSTSSRFARSRSPEWEPDRHGADSRQCSCCSEAPSS
jgi:hypothetical protein